jgi:ribosomal protein S12 methylthiotransferase accessory factor
LSALRKLDLGGTFRACDPAATWAHIEPLLPVFGITRVADITGLDRIGIPVAMCVRPNARSLSVSQGKGASRELARISAVMESIEFFHAEHVRPPEIVASYHEMRRRHAALNPKELKPGFRSQAYHARRKIGWTRGRDLVTGEPVFLPHSILDLDTTAAGPDVGLFGATTNGLASGNDRWEAICHGLFEAIERDCDWRWSRLSPSAQQELLLDNDTIDSPLVRSYLDRCADAGVAARIWEITSDLGIPVYRCIIRDIEAWRPLGADYGAGCHVSKEIALSRAITEAAQSRLTIIAGARDDIFPAYYERQQTRWTVGRKSLLAAGKRDYRARPGLRPVATFEADARYTISRLAGAGYRRVIAVDHTRDDLGVPTIHVIVPGLQCCK